MNSTIWGKTLNEFLNDIASDDPTPGGGAVSSITGAFGAGLVIMALEVSARKVRKKNPAKSDLIITHVTKCRQLMERLKAAPDEDMRVFEGYLDAVKNARNQQSDLDEEVIQNALFEAGNAPLEAAKIMLLILKEADESSELISPSIRSDLVVGKELLTVGIRTVIENVFVNANAITDAHIATRFKSEAEEILENITTGCL